MSHARMTVAALAEIRALGLAVKAARKLGHTRKAAQIRKQQRDLREQYGVTFGSYVAKLQEREYNLPTAKRSK